MKVSNLAKIGIFTLVVGMVGIVRPAAATKRGIIHQAIRSEAIYQSRKAMRTAVIGAAAAETTYKVAKKVKKYTDTSKTYKKMKTKAKATAVKAKNYSKKAYKAVKEAVTEAEE